MTNTCSIGLVLSVSLAIVASGCNGNKGNQDMNSKVDQNGPSPDLTASADLRGSPDLTATPADMTALPPDLMGLPNVIIVGMGGALSFTPNTLTINAGDTVTWFWASSGHDVVGGMAGTPNDSFCSPSDTTPCNSTNSPTSPAGTVYSHKFDVLSGNYPYFCRPHAGAGMTGTIVVN